MLMPVFDMTTSAERVHGREPDRVASYYPIPQDGGTNRWQKTLASIGERERFPNT